MRTPDRDMSETPVGAPTARVDALSGRAALDALLLSLLLAALAVGLEPALRWDAVLPWAIALSCLTVLPAFALGAYRRAPGRSLLRVPMVLIFSCGAFWLLPWPQAVLPQLAWQAPLVVAALYLARDIASGSLPLRIKRRFLVLGSGDEALAVRTALEGLADIRIAGHYPLLSPNPASSLAPLLSSALSLDRTVSELQVTDIVVAVSERRGGVLPQDDLLACRLRGVRIFDLSSFFERSHGQVRVDSLRASWLIYGEGFRQGAWRVASKRVFDLVSASLLLIACAPLMLIAALAVLLDSPGPVFYRQERVGHAGRRFRVIKFRSMRIDAERDGTPRWAGANDSRITRVGRIIRRFRIDELPQLWNVLRGEMSLIGPRPERPFFVAQLNEHIPFYAIRHSIKPGLTGWAQVRYHYGDSIEDAVEKLQYDLYYLKHNSLTLDLIILLATVRVVLTGQGAH